MKQNFNPEIWLVDRREFNPAQWLTVQKPEKRTGRTNAAQDNTKGPISKSEEMEVIIQRIESSRLDLTANYSDWLSVGFALAEGFGESGRGYFHRLSRFHPGYNYNECNNQFNKCLKANKTGITLKTIFYLAMAAGINVKV